MIGIADPLLPDGDEARRWAEKELSDPVYDVAEPTLLDRAAKAIGDFLGSLFDPQLGGEWSPLVAIVVLLVIAALVVTAVLIWGRPRLAHRTAGRDMELFGDSEQRSADELRRAAAGHAAAAEWDAAVVTRFRAVARGLAERDVVVPTPGMTAQGLARRASSAFPVLAGELATAATAFDDVRYLRRPGSEAMYLAVSRADDAVVAARPADATAGPVGAAR